MCICEEKINYEEFLFHFYSIKGNWSQLHYEIFFIFLLYNDRNFHYKGFDSIEEKKFFRCLFFLRKEALLWTLYAISPENSVLLKKRLQWCPIVIGNKAMRPTFSTRETINHEFQLWNSFVFLSFFFFVNEISISW